MVELGNKHECLSCSTKFYDLGKSELICPKCGGNQKELAEAGEDQKKKTPGRKSSAKTKKKSKKKPKKKATKAKSKSDAEVDDDSKSAGEEE